jgi:hypothetical protein
MTEREAAAMRVIEAYAEIARRLQAKIDRLERQLAHNDGDDA